MPFSRLLVAALLASLAPAAALAQTAEQDVRCVIVSNFFGAAEKDPQRRQLALATGLFFAGRADAHVPPAQFKALVASQGKALTADTAPGVMTGCAKQFQAKELAMRAVGRAVAEAQRPAPAAPAKK